MYLSYARGIKWYRRLPIRRLAVDVGVVAILLLAWYVWRDGPGLWEKYWMLRTQGQCERFKFDSRLHWVYSDYESDVAALSSDASYEKLFLPYPRMNCVFLKPAECWLEFHKHIAPDLFAGAGGYKGDDTDPPGTLLFLGKRVAAGGTARLVVIWLRLGAGGPAYRIGLGEYAVAEGDRTNPPVFSYRGGAPGGGLDQVANAGSNLRIGSGYADPDDSSRFYIPWEVDGKEHRMVGTLKEDAPFAGFPKAASVELTGGP